MTFVLFEEWEDEATVEDSGTMAGRVEHPDEECYFHDIVEWNKC